MLIIIHLMLSRYRYLDGIISCYFAGPAPKAKLSAEAGGPCLFFSCLFKQGLAVCGDVVIGSAQQMRPLSRPVMWERAPLIESSGRSTVLAPVEEMSPELAGRVWGFL